MARQVSFNRRWSGLRAGAAALTLAATGLGLCTLRAKSPQEPLPPMTRIEPMKDNYHGVEVTDPYRWLEDQQSPATRAWIDAQNKYTQSLLTAWPEREELKRRVASLLKIESIDVPTERKGLLFFIKRRADQDQGVLCVRKGLDGGDEIHVDPNPLRADHSVSVLLEGVSEDGALVAYGLRQGGEDENTVQIRDVLKNTDLPDALPKAVYFNIAIKPDKSGFVLFARREGARGFLPRAGHGPGEDRRFSAKVMARTRSLSVTSRRMGVTSLFMSYTGRRRTRRKSMRRIWMRTGPLNPS